ncbi:hypothetical protein SAMN04488104_102847 [Algoriphagus faecimaris]|uniref:Dolichyl-phosphate-mannose-protein mannosyltransferase n=1 Tax=Algoriphagus faecimaris TaxID=686796 RepID=A0A1G6UHB7_9BACT|nr:hypothetical protein [Algoriphagus faecimaris]SDD40810.1 hypothetical protein SAMN04488104_102847 [Algoriphagus faecimaris]
MKQVQPNTKPSRFAYTWIAIGFLAILIFYFLPWRFQVNDDVIMMWLVSGAYTGESETYAVFMHPLLSTSLSFLYQHLPPANWYSIYQYFLIFFAFSFSSRVIQKSVISTRSKSIYQVILLLISLHLCIFPQFTLVAGWSAFAALLSIISDHKDSKTITFSLLLLLLSGILRAEASLLIWIGFAWFALTKFQKTKVLRLGIALGVILVLIASKTIWENQSEYKEYLEFNKARHKVIDHPVFYQNTIEEFYKNDPKWRAFSNWFIQESPIEIIDLKLHQKELNHQYFSTKQIMASLTRLVQVHSMELFKSFLANTFLFLYWIHFRTNKKMLFLAFAWILFLLIFNHFNHIRGRVIFLFYLPILIPVLEQSLHFKTKLKFILTLCLFGLFLSIHVANFLKEANKRKEYLSQYESIIEQKRQDIPLYLESFPLEYFSQYYPKGEKTRFFIEGWIARSPFQEKAYQRLGFTRLGEFKSYFLLADKTKGPYDFPDYINKLGADYQLKSKTETSDLILFEYSRE